MDKQALANDLDASLKGLQKAIESFDETTFNAAPAAGGWSPAQVAEHLVITEAAAVKALTGETVPNNRQADGKVALIEAVMRDETKRTAPQQVLPVGRIATPQQAIELLNRQRQKLVDAVYAASDLTEACTGVKHPALGTLTKWEWVQFVVHHMHRHLRQLKRTETNDPGRSPAASV